MHFHKSEIYFFLLLLLIGLAGVSAYSAWATAADLVRVDPRLDPILRFSYFSMVISGLSVACGVLLIYPALKVGVAEQGKLRRMTESLSERSETLEHAAVTDALTGMHNRRYFDDAMREYLAAFTKIDKPVGMIILDLDHFKVVNDTHGHDVGDAVLRQVALCLREFTRYHDVVARIGGEEFAILSPNTPQRQLFDLAERIRRAVEALTIIDGDLHLKVTVSAGIAVWDGQESGEQLYRRTDKQLYKAKRAGRNRVCAT
ncbi:GGDEF domain-containing protein [Pseudohoeflea coraliihabitans]|uniref:diguanylate cyclase n=1 Tax=Pseudohoeflea coraliihabitans TaxID=2860393 RepID=A0ABS6WKA8_9HYPH|nr:GGDEF domain-containing protein [Pseudohoeflea sp. DP4N28-3]MBW3095877.1 GGDEF domain-containing protein [Pseudohoeflea sp. DP4N28-3]